MVEGLRFTVKAVREFNKKHKGKYKEMEEQGAKPFDVLVNYLMMLDIDAITLLIGLGMQTTEEKAEELLQAELDKTGDLIKVADELKEVITKQGFTPWARGMNLTQQYTKALESVEGQMSQVQAVEEEL